jgi:hypothetical protein
MIGMIMIKISGSKRITRNIGRRALMSIAQTDLAIAELWYASGCSIRVIFP